MIYRCIEKGREKCDHYWPYDTEPVYYGDIQVSNPHHPCKAPPLILMATTLQVTILNESHFPDWNINEFRMMRGDTVPFPIFVLVVVIMNTK